MACSTRRRIKLTCSSCITIYITRSIFSVPLKASLEKDVDHASPQDFFLPPGEHFLGGAWNCCSAVELILYDILPSSSSLRLRHRVHARGLLFLPVEDTLRTMLPTLVRLKEFREFAGTGSQRYTGRAKFLQWLATYALRLLRIFWNFLPFSDLDSDQTSSS